MATMNFVAFLGEKCTKNTVLSAAKRFEEWKGFKLISSSKTRYD